MAATQQGGSGLRIPGEYSTHEERRQIDEEITGRIRCIGCGKFVARSAHWNQCGDCDTRYPEEM
jgi:rRNA maturation endonuclease Nob1